MIAHLPQLIVSHYVAVAFGCMISHLPPLALRLVSHLSLLALFPLLSPICLLIGLSATPGALRILVHACLPTLGASLLLDACLDTPRRAGGLPCSS